MTHLDISHEAMKSFDADFPLLLPALATHPSITSLDVTEAGVGVRGVRACEELLKANRNVVNIIGSTLLLSSSTASAALSPSLDSHSRDASRDASHGRDEANGRAFSPRQSSVPCSRSKTLTLRGEGSSTSSAALKVPKKASQSLLTLYIAENVAYQTFLKTLPDAVGSPPSYCVTLTRRNLHQIPSPLFHSPNTELLTSLDLSLNDLESLPEEICLFRNLETLQLSRNALRALPFSIGSFTKLRNLDVSANNLIGFPTTFRQLGSSLEILDISANQFANLPLFLRRFSRLERFSMKGNPMKMKEGVDRDGNSLTWLRQLEEESHTLTHVSKLAIFAEHAEDAEALRNILHDTTLTRKSLMPSHGVQGHNRKNSKSLPSSVTLSAFSSIPSTPSLSSLSPSSLLSPRPSSSLSARLPSTQSLPAPPSLQIVSLTPRESSGVTPSPSASQFLKVNPARRSPNTVPGTPPEISSSPNALLRGKKSDPSIFASHHPPNHLRKKSDPMVVTPHYPSPKTAFKQESCPVSEISLNESDTLEEESHPQPISFSYILSKSVDYSFQPNDHTLPSTSPTPHSSTDRSSFLNLSSQSSIAHPSLSGSSPFPVSTLSPSSISFSSRMIATHIPDDHSQPSRKSSIDMSKPQNLPSPSPSPSPPTSSSPLSPSFHPPSEVRFSPLPSPFHSFSFDHGAYDLSLSVLSASINAISGIPQSSLVMTSDPLLMTSRKKGQKQAVFVRALSVCGDVTDMVYSIPLIVGCDTTSFVVVRSSAGDGESERSWAARLGKYELMVRMFSEQCPVTFVVFGEEEENTARTVAFLQSHLEKCGKSAPQIVTVNPSSGKSHFRTISSIITLILKRNLRRIWRHLRCRK